METAVVKPEACLLLAALRKAGSQRSSSSGHLLALAWFLS